MAAFAQQLAAQAGQIPAAAQAAPIFATGGAVAFGAVAELGVAASVVTFGKVRLEQRLEAAYRNDPAFAMGGVLGGPQKGFILPAGTDAGDAGEFLSLRQTDPMAADRKLAEIQNKAAAGSRATSPSGSATQDLIRNQLPELSEADRNSFEGEPRLRTFKAGDRVYRSPHSLDEDPGNPGPFFGTRETSTKAGTESQYNLKRHGNVVGKLRTYEFKKDTTVHYGQVKDGKGYQALIPRDTKPADVVQPVDEKDLK